MPVEGANMSHSWLQLGSVGTDSGCISASGSAERTSPRAASLSVIAPHLVGAESLRQLEDVRAVREPADLLELDPGGRVERARVEARACGEPNKDLVGRRLSVRPSAGHGGCDNKKRAREGEQKREWAAYGQRRPPDDG